MFIFFALGMVTCCGYNLRGQQRSFFESKQIRTLYVAPVKNDSFKAGIEITVYNALRKKFAQWGYVKIVDSTEQSDAQLLATVISATVDPAGITLANQLAGGVVTPNNVEIASSYNATLKVKIELRGKGGATFWSNIMSASQGYQAATYTGSLGATSALINESQFDDALVKMASSIVFDAEESMNTGF